MSFKYILYVVLLLLLSLSSFLYLELGDVEERFKKREEELIRLKAELSRKKAMVDHFKERVRREGVVTLSEREALERLFGFIDELKASYEIRITKDVRKEGNVWVVDLKLSTQPSGSRELVMKLKSLADRSSPVVFVRRVLISVEPKPAAEIDISLKQPFMEGGNEANKV